MKICSKCGTEKPNTDFYKHPLGREGRAADCRACRKSARDASVKAVDPRLRAYRAACNHRYEVQPDRKSYENAPLPGKMCILCNHETRLVGDHDHKTGKFRAWICGSCNSRLRKLERDMPYLLRVAEYLGLVGPEL